MSIKITPDHRDRQAYVYVRQSTADQLLHNHESRRRQYALTERARALGWSEVVIVDDDLGRSGGGVERPGFDRLLLAICEARVGIVLAGYSAKTARVAGCKNITKVNIAAEIEKAQVKRAERCEVTADWVIDELRKLASANMADYMKSTPEGGIVLDFAGLTRDQAGALSQVKVNGESVTFKLHDKRAALVDLGRYLGLFEKRRQQDVITVEADFTDVRDKIFRTLARLSAARIPEGSGQIPDPGGTVPVAE